MDEEWDDWMSVAREAGNAPQWSHPLSEWCLLLRGWPEQHKRQVHPTFVRSPWPELTAREAYLVVREIFTRPEGCGPEALSTAFEMPVEKARAILAVRVLGTGTA